MRPAVAVLILILAGCGAFENEGRADEASATLHRYLEALGGASPDRGWALLNQRAQELYPGRDYYLELAETAEDADLPVHDIELLYEDDGFYLFSVTTADPLHLAYAELLFRPGIGGSGMACLSGSGQFEIGVIIAPFNEHDGVTGPAC